MPQANNPNGKSLGMGGESVENLHAAQQNAAGAAPSPAAASQQNAASTGTDGGDRSGSEPLEGREWQHEPGYGGKLGAPRSSADNREPADPSGDANVGGGNAAAANPSPS